MPKIIHKQLVKTARKKGLTGKRFKAFVFGTLAKIEKTTKLKRKRSRK